MWIIEEREPLQPLTLSQREALEEATAAYQGQLTADAAAYLIARGITKETAVTFRLGVVVDPMPGHARFVGSLAIPYLGHDGRVLSIRFRCLQQHNHRDFAHGKYMSIADEPARVYNVGAIHRAGDTLDVAEGEFDAQILTQLGLYAVSIPGANAWQKHHRRMLAGFNCVRVWGDPDDAGADFINKVTRALPRARGVRLRTGDVTETYLAGGAEAVLSLVREEGD